MSIGLTGQQIEHPDYRPGRGEHFDDRGIRLYREAIAAHKIWRVIWLNRLEAVRTDKPVDPYKSIDRTALDRLMADDTDKLAQLVRTAVHDATTRSAPGRDELTAADRTAMYEAARIIGARYSDLTGPAPSLVPAGYADETCRHGRRFDADCDDCGI